ncbi:MAG TPA: DUF2249 domain-containing protein [Edaphobacter sp.]|nr:DUF2249 domain-containing protein [Edaphobacter sp.]
MQKFNIKDQIEFSDSKFNAKVLVNEPGYRLVLLSLRKGQAVPEHANPAIVMVYAIAGHITFYQEQEGCELRTGEAVRIPAGAPHHLEAHEDSALYVIAAGQTSASPPASEELDLREVPRPLRHPLVFRKLDGLSMGESFVLVNDHDPIPLNRQIEQMRPGQAQWKYLQRGPEIFRIEVRRVGPSRNSDVAFEPQFNAIISEIGTR